ncbi:MAG: dTMP kinase [Patescibacteria group bacterium]|nr:dTMP kinase [Patescibacteria group bacterium]
MTKRGRLIIIDGIDGVGKTQQARLLNRQLKKLKFKTVLTSEPYHKDIIKLIKKSFYPSSDFFLFLADRNLHYQKIDNLLKQGYVIICDRSFPSTWAYQFYASNLKEKINRKTFLKIDLLSRNFIKPDIVLILDIKPELALKRLSLKNKKSQINKFEKLDFLRRVRKYFLLLAKEFSWTIINAEKSLEEVHLLITKVVQNKLRLRL